MSKTIKCNPANYEGPKIPMPPVKPPKHQCEHKFIYMQTVRQHGEQPWIGVRPGKEWKRIDRFYCEKCLEFKEITKTAMCYKEKPEWFD
jgi:hypothetical protein